MAIREWTLVILCHYDLTNYPFDTQRCPLSLLLAKYTSDLFVVGVGNYTFSGNRRHHQYELRYISIHNFTMEGYAGQRLMLVLRNQYIYYISAAYVPSCMLLVISYLTYYYTLEDFQTRITVALTALLVLATLFSELVGGLPKTSYLKLIDVWFLACIVANFCMVVCLVLIEKQRSWLGGLSSVSTSWGGFRRIFHGDRLSAQSPSSVRRVTDATGISTINKVRPIDSGSGEHQTGKKHSESEEQKDDNWQVSKSRLNSIMKITIPIVMCVFIAAYIVSVVVILNS